MPILSFNSAAFNTTPFNDGASSASKTQPAISRIATTRTKTQTSSAKLAQNLIAFQFSTARITVPAYNLRDNFDDNIIDTTLWAAGGNAWEVNSHVQIDSTGAGNGSYNSVGLYDIRGSQVFVQYVQSAGTGNDYVLYLGDPGLTNFADWDIAGGILLCHTYNGGFTQYGPPLTYVPATHKYFRMRESAGTFYWDWSTDGVSWTNYTSVATASLPWNLSQTQIDFSGNLHTTGTSIWDNLNCLSPTKTQPAIARIATTRTKTQASISRIATKLTKIQSATARIATKPTKVQPSVARIEITLTKTQTATAGIGITRTLSQSSIALVVQTPLALQSHLVINLDLKVPLPNTLDLRTPVITELLVGTTISIDLKVAPALTLSLPSNIIKIDLRQNGVITLGLQ